MTETEKLDREFGGPTSVIRYGDNKQLRLYNVNGHTDAHIVTTIARALIPSVMDQRAATDSERYLSKLYTQEGR